MTEESTIGISYCMVSSCADPYLCVVGDFWERSDEVSSIPSQVLQTRWLFIHQCEVSIP